MPPSLRRFPALRRAQAGNLASTDDIAPHGATIHITIRQQSSVQMPTAPTSSSVTWRPLGAVPPTALVDARVQLHHAAQVTNAAAISLLPPAADDSHTSF